MAAYNTGASIKPAKNKKNFNLLILVLLVVLVGTNIFFYFRQSAASDTPNQLGLGTTKTEIMDMGELVVNLAGNGGGHYLRVQIVLEYPNDKKLSKELNSKKIQTLDLIITTLRSKTLDDVHPVDKMDSLKSSLMAEINKTLDNGKVSAIYFTDYLVQ